MANQNDSNDRKPQTFKVPAISERGIADKAKTAPTFSADLMAEGTTVRDIKAAPSKAVAPNTLQTVDGSKGIYRTPDNRFVVTKTEQMVEGRKATLWEMRDTKPETTGTTWRATTYAPSWMSAREVLKARYIGAGLWPSEIPTDK
jgi:hypothetical protein